MPLAAEVVLERPHQQAAGAGAVELADEERMIGIGLVEGRRQRPAIALRDLGCAAPVGRLERGEPLGERQDELAIGGDGGTDDSHCTRVAAAFLA